MIDSFNISGKNILITGANGFLGKHLFEYILNKNGNPILIDINNNNILKSKFKKKIENNSLYFKTDITDEIEEKIL